VVNAANAGLGVVVRMHWGYGGSGTLPNSSHYSIYAANAASFCQAHQDYCRYYIVGNEANLNVEWPAWGDGLDATVEAANCAWDRQKITPERYADCFIQTYSAVAAVAPECRLILSPGATWAGLFVCSPGGTSFDCLDFICYTDTLYSLIPHSMIGGLAFHPKTHTHNPGEITSEAMAGNPYGCSQNVWVHWNFRVYRDELDRIPSDLRRRPIFFTELNPHEPAYGGWSNTNNGYVTTAFNEISNWNATHSDRKITAMMLYRWDDGMSCWDIWDRPQVQDDLRSAVSTGQQNPGFSWYDGAGPSPTPTSPPATDTPTLTTTFTASPTVTPFCFGDADRNSFVNGDDYRCVAENFGVAECAAGDADGNCFVNANDYRTVRDYFGSYCP
jgi:hypothetical protein